MTPPGGLPLPLRAEGSGLPLRPLRMPAVATPALGTLEGRLAAATVFLSPMNYFRLEAAFVTLSDLLACATLLVMLLQGRLPRAPFGIATSFWLAGFLALAAGLTLGSVAHAEMGGLVVILAQYFFSLVVLPFVLAGRPYREAIALLKVLAASIVAVMVFGIWVIHFVPDPDLRFVSYSGRLRSLVERQNECAALGAIAIVLLLNLALLREVRARTVALALPILLYGIVLTGSNTGILMLALGVAVTVIFSGSARAMIGCAALTGAAVAAVLAGGDAFLPEVFRERVLAALMEGNITEAGTFEGRFHLMQDAVEISRHTLLFGLGADQYREVSAHGAPVHNTYMLLLAEGGMLSLMGLVMMLMTGAFLGWAAIVHGRARMQGLVTLVIVVIFAAMLNTFPHFYARFWNVPLILALGLAAACLVPGATPRPMRGGR